MFLENLNLDRILNIFNSTMLVIVTIILGFLVFINFESRENSEQGELIAFQENAEAEESKSDDSLAEVETNSNEINVDIKGAVKNPGVYKVNEDSIINDVIKLAGGLKSNASTKYTNLSKKVSNEMVITIYTTSQINQMSSPTTEICNAPTENISNCQNSSIVEIKPSSNENKNETNSESTNKDNKISLNSATKEELMTLTGVGEAKAESIIEYREKNNGFKTLEELMNISGIGEKAYEKIKDNIKL